MYFPWTDLQFLVVTTSAGLAFGWLCWPALRSFARAPGAAAPSPCARCAVGAAASCAHAKAATAPAAAQAADGAPLVQLGGSRRPPPPDRAGI